jgi:hypothetical protein
MADLSTFEQYYKLADMLIEKATKEQLTECARKRGDAVRTGPEEGRQIDMFAYSSAGDRSGRLMDTVDQINRKYRCSTVHLASEGVDRTWSMRRSFKSPNYTGDWDELPVAS